MIKKRVNREIDPKTARKVEQGMEFAKLLKQLDVTQQAGLFQVIDGAKTFSMGGWKKRRINRRQSAPRS